MSATILYLLARDLGLVISEAEVRFSKFIQAVQRSPEEERRTLYEVKLLVRADNGTPSDDFVWFGDGVVTLDGIPSSLSGKWVTISLLSALTVYAEFEFPKRCTCLYELADELGIRFFPFEFRFLAFLNAYKSLDIMSRDRIADCRVYVSTQGQDVGSPDNHIELDKGQFFGQDLYVGMVRVPILGSFISNLDKLERATWLIPFSFFCLDCRFISAVDNMRQVRRDMDMEGRISSDVDVHGSVNCVTTLASALGFKEKYGNTIDKLCRDVSGDYYHMRWMVEYFVDVTLFAKDDKHNHVRYMGKVSNSVLQSPAVVSDINVNFPSKFPVFAYVNLYTFLTVPKFREFKYYASTGVSPQFYKPTRFSQQFSVENAFQSCGQVSSQHHLTLDEASSWLMRNKADAVVGSSLEPGSGKTTVLPFRFQTSRVAVILPTGFDAWAAYRSASGVANVDTGVKKEENGSRVTYMDSYTAGFMIYKSRKAIPYDIVIIDESDSSAGITNTLIQLKLPSVYIIHLTGTPEGRVVNTTTGFPVEVSDDLPPLEDDYVDAVEFIKQKAAGGRSMVMVPNSRVATKLSKMIANSRLVSDTMPVDELDALLLNQTQSEIIVADDSCTRGFNLNLGTVFDFQLVANGENSRTTTEHERMQRMLRVGRLKPGRYFCSPVKHSKSSFTQFDIFRNNVARAVFGLPLEKCKLDLDVTKVTELMVSDVEPYSMQLALKELVTSAASTVSTSRKVSVTQRVPEWYLYTTTYMGKRSKGSSSSSELSVSKESKRDSFYTSYSHKREASAVSSSSSEVTPSQSASRRATPTEVAVKPNISTIVDGFSAFQVANTKPRSPQVVSQRPPPIDLSLGSSDEWPLALKVMYEGKDALPRVLPGVWKYTSGGSGVDFLQRLACVVEEGPRYSAPEFELVCRAWNVLVGRSAYSFAGGRDAWGDDAMITFCLEYFDNYNFNNLL